MMADKCLAEGVERAGADVPENDADGRQRPLGQPVLAMAVNLYRFAAVSRIDTGDVRLGLSSGHATSVIGPTAGGQAAIPHIVTPRGGAAHTRLHAPRSTPPCRSRGVCGTFRCLVKS